MPLSLRSSLRGSKRLTDSISDAELQLSNRQRQINVRTTQLVHDIHRQMTAPASLLLAGGIGFLMGELTQRNPPKIQSNPNATPSVDTTPLQDLLKLITFGRTAYTTLLPLAWMVKSFRQRDASPPPEQPSQAIDQPPDRYC